MEKNIPNVTSTEPVTSNEEASDQDSNDKDRNNKSNNIQEQITNKQNITKSRDILNIPKLLNCMQLQYVNELLSNNTLPTKN